MICEENVEVGLKAKTTTEYKNPINIFFQVEKPIKYPVEIYKRLLENNGMDVSGSIRSFIDAFLQKKEYNEESAIEPKIVILLFVLLLGADKISNREVN